jgi:hypothetical protein
MTTIEKANDTEDRLYAAERLGYKVHQDMSGWYGVNRQDRRITQPFSTAQEALEAVEQRMLGDSERIEENVGKAKIPASLLGIELPTNGDYAVDQAHYYIEKFSPESGDFRLCGPGKLQLAGAIAEQVARRGFHVRYTTAAEVIRAGTQVELLEADLVVLNLGDLPAGCGSDRFDGNQVLAALAAPHISDFLKRRREHAEHRRQTHGAKTRGATMLVTECTEAELGAFME